jgi:hypothetical protein
MRDQIVMNEPDAVGVGPHSIAIAEIEVRFRVVEAKAPITSSAAVRPSIHATMRKTMILMNLRRANLCNSTFT